MGLLRAIFKRSVNRPKRKRCGIVVAAAGRSRRMGGEDKLFAPLLGVPALEYTLRALDQCPDVDEIIVVTTQENILAVGDIARNAQLGKVTKVVRGGKGRLQSVSLGVAEVSKHCELIAVHDGARPLVTSELVSGVVRLAAECGAAAPAVAPKDTVKEARDGLVIRTVPRDTLQMVQTPQVFDAALLRAALVKAEREGLRVTDDCSVIEAMGMSVRLSEGSYENFKLTTPEDLALAETVLRRRMEWPQ